MNYEEMSNRDIECLVWIAGDSKPRKYVKDGRCLVLVSECGREIIQEVPKYCSNPSDAWQIIVDNAIALLPNTEYLLNRELKKFKMEYKGGYVASAFPTMPDGFSGDEISVMDKNPLRAAMTCFLKMKDAER